tara:strand:+ start:5419 stop:5958 length:540 start_codon:yes stop_codon:yes gene_type:complete
MNQRIFKHGTAGNSVKLEVEARDLMKKLGTLEKYPARRALHAAGVYSTRLIDKETSRLYLKANYKTPPRKKGFRKSIAIKSGFKYKTSDGYGILKFVSSLNFARGAMHIGRWLERGHATNGGGKVPAWNLRAVAFRRKKRKAQKAFIKALGFSFDMVANSKNGTVSMKALESLLGDPWR